MFHRVPAGLYQARPPIPDRQTEIRDIKGRSWINPAPVCPAYILKMSCTTVEKGERRSFRARACEMNFRVYLRSPIEVHYVDINNSVQKCRPSWVSLCLAADGTASGTERKGERVKGRKKMGREKEIKRESPAVSRRKPEITKEPQTKLFRPKVWAETVHTMQKRWRWLVVTCAAINCPTTHARPRFFLALFLFTKQTAPLLFPLLFG